MVAKSKNALSRHFTVDDLIQLLDSIGLTGVQLKPSNGDVNRDIGPLQPVISQLRESSTTNGPLSEAIEIVSSLLQASKKEDETQHIWKALGDAGISIEALVELIQHLSENDPSPLAIAAAGLYFALLRLSGAFLYHVFSALVFRTCITSLKKWIYAVAGTKIFICISCDCPCLIRILTLIFV